MSDNKANITVDGDISPLRQKLREAGQAFKRFGDDGETAINRMTGPLGALQERFIAVGAVLAGGAVFREAVAQAKEWTEQSIDMAAALGISATEAGNLKAALADEGVEVETFMAAAQKLAANLKNDESALQAVGLATRDAAGNLRPLNALTVEAIELTGQYKAGTDRAIAATTLFGKGFEIAGDLAKINSELIAENTERQQALAATVTNESIAAFEEYDVASKGVDATLRAIWQTIGTVLMPVLATLANWFVSIGPAAVVAIRGALGGLASAFHLVTTGVTVLWETLNALVVSVAEPIRAMAMAIGKAVTGDFAGAAAELRGITGVISSAWGQAFDTIVEKAASTRERIWNIFSGGTPTVAAKVDGKSAEHLIKTDPAKATKKPLSPADTSYMLYYEAALAEEKRLAAEKDALREYSKAQELAYWRTLLDHADLSGKDRMAIERKVADLSVVVWRDAARQQQALDVEARRFGEQYALGEVDAAQVAADAALAVGATTNEQRLQQEIQFEQQRYEIRRSYAEARLQLLAADPETNVEEMARLKNQLLELEQQYQTARIGLQGRLGAEQKRLAEESGQVWDALGSRMSSLWDSGIQAMMNGTLTWRNAFKAVGTELVGWFANSVVGDMVKTWLKQHAVMLAAKLGFISQEKAMQLAGSAAVVATKTAETTAVSTANAVQAGTGAAASQAPIPIVGPVLALAAMASVFAAVSALGGRIASASRGYDIPAGLNPMTQLHEEEMVLPQKYANVIRGLAAGESQASAGPVFAPSIAVTAMDARGVQRALKEGGALHKALKELHRGFAK